MGCRAWALGFRVLGYRAQDSSVHSEPRNRTERSFKQTSVGMQETACSSQSFEQLLAGDIWGGFPKIGEPQHSTLHSRILILRTPK